MSKESRYKLASSKFKKGICPQCGKKNHWQMYYDTESNDSLISEQYGRCDNSQKCGYYELPPLETLCFGLDYTEIKEISDKSYLVKQNNLTGCIPKSAIFEKNDLNIYVGEYFLKDEKKVMKGKFELKYNENNRKYFKNIGVCSLHTTKPKREIIKKEITYFNYEAFKKTLIPENYDKNIFIQNLLNKVQYPFEVDEITKVIQLYQLGTVADGYRAGAISFPFIDINNKIRAIQVKQFNEENKTIGTDFLHSIIEKYLIKNNKPLPEWLEAYNKNETKVSCLFAEYFLNKYPKADVFLFEAPKTAIYNTLYFGFPENSNIICLAVYNKSSFSFDKLKVLQGRCVFVFPDLSKDGNTFKEWENKAKEFEKNLPNTKFIFSDLLEKLATEKDKNEGLDIADILINHDWRKFRKQQPQPEPEKVTKVTKVTPEQNFLFSNITPLPKVNLPQQSNIEYSYIEKKDNWNDEINELTVFFEGFNYNQTTFQLNSGELISNIETFINSHLEVIKAHNGAKGYKSYLDRLLRFKNNVLNLQQ